MIKNVMVNNEEIFVKGSRFSIFFPHVCTCKKVLKEAECEYLGRTSMGKIKKVYWFNCPHCKTTFIKKHERVL